MITLPKTIKWIITDFDGIVTDNCVYINDDYTMTRRLNYQDIIGFNNLRKNAYEIAIISGEKNPAIELLKEKFNITEVHQKIKSKLDVLKAIIKKAHEVGAIAIVDGAQGAPHMATDVQDLDCDFYAFSGHKMLAPMGIGVLYGKKSILEQMPPFLRGGEMIETVSEQDATFAPLPAKFEAGTPNVSGAIALKAAIEYINQVGFSYIEQQEEKLMKIAMEELSKLPYITIYGSPDYKKHKGVLSFNIQDIHPHDVSSLVDYHGNIALRAGNHCAHPLLKYLNAQSTNRISFYFYNTKEDVYQFIEQIKKVRSYLGYDV